MQRFYFHNENGHLIRDEDGMELPDLRTARIEAVKFLGEMLRSSPDFWATETLTVRVANEAGHVLYVVEASGRAVQ